jgi:hypothetical protein
MAPEAPARTGGEHPAAAEPAARSDRGERPAAAEPATRSDRGEHPAAAEPVPARGAYGLRLPDLAGAGELLVEAPATWREWRVEHRAGAGQPAEFVHDDRARLRSEPDGWIELDRAARRSRVHLPHRPDDRELLHPRLASTAGVAARWHGLQSFHAGAFVHGGRAWALMGARGDGKSSLLAQLALDGVPILTDDVLVVRGTCALAGPRCVDLRREAAAALGAGEPLGVVGTRERWRLRTGAVAPEVALGGWVRPAWGEPGVERIAPDERLVLVFASLSLRVEPRDPAALMELAALPGLVLRRPRRIDALAQSAQRLLEAVERLGARAA